MSWDPRTLPPGPAILFCPGDRPDRYQKALAAADTIILDLEDAVSPGHKDEARKLVRDALLRLPIERTMVRINSPRSEAGCLDLAMLADTPVRFVVVPKVEAAADLALGAFSTVALCETARGVQGADDIARASGCVALMWGGEDLTADIGGRKSHGRDALYLPHVQYARARVLIAAASAAIAAWDGVYLDIHDHKGLGLECHDAVAMGFAAKVAIHPSHAPIIRAAYQPSPEQHQWAERVLTAVREAGSGVISFEGQMIDGPLIAMAENTLASSASEPNGIDNEDEYFIIN